MLATMRILIDELLHSRADVNADGSRKGLRGLSPNEFVDGLEGRQVGARCAWQVKP